MIYLDLDDLLYVAAHSIGAPAEVRDLGLLEAAAARPQTTRLTMANDEAYDLIIGMAACELAEVDDVADLIERACTDR